MRPILLPLLLTRIVPMMGLAQTTPLQGVLDGSAVPPSFTTENFPSELRAVRLAIDQQFNIFSLYAMQSPAGLRGSGGSQEVAQATATFMECLAANWTKGERIKVDGEEFLVTYKMDIPLSVLDSSSAFKRWTEIRGFTFRLELIRPSSIISMSPSVSLTITDVKAAFEVIQSASRMQDTPATAYDSGVPADGQHAPSQPTFETSPYEAQRIAAFIQEYASHYDQKFPTAKTITELQQALRPYMTKDIMWIWKTGNPKKSQYVYNSNLSGLVISNILSPWKVPMIYESAPWPDGKRIVVFVDGSVKRLSDKEWKEAQKFLKAKVGEK